VDDEPGIRRMLKLFFEQEGFTVYTIANGLEALGFPPLRAGEIDIVITDLVMPGMNGLALAEKLKAQQPNLPVLIVSASADCVDVGSSSGAQILTKPFDVTYLLDLVRQLLSKRVSPAAA
jgi:DNA-binding response OmpR family regulator